MKYTIHEIATERNLWEERVDPDNCLPNSFDIMTVEEKEEMVIEMYGQDQDDPEYPLN